MYLVIGTDRAQLFEPENCREFSARIVDAVFRLDLVAVIAQSGVGELDDDQQHIQVRVDWLRQMAEGRVGPNWADDFTAMLSYARTKGWLNDAGDRVRAHIEAG